MEDFEKKIQMKIKKFELILRNVVNPRGEAFSFSPNEIFIVEKKEVYYKQKIIFSTKIEFGEQIYSSLKATKKEINEKNIEEFILQYQKTFDFKKFLKSIQEELVLKIQEIDAAEKAANEAIKFAMRHTTKDFKYAEKIGKKLFKDHFFIVRYTPDYDAHENSNDVYAIFHEMEHIPYCLPVTHRMCGVKSTQNYETGSSYCSWFINCGGDVWTSKNVLIAQYGPVNICGALSQAMNGKPGITITDSF